MPWPVCAQMWRSWTFTPSARSRARALLLLLCFKLAFYLPVTASLQTLPRTTPRATRNSRELVTPEHITVPSEVPSRSPFGNVPSVRSARARLARSARASTAPRAAVRDGRPRSLRVHPRAADWRTQERDFTKTHLDRKIHFTYILTRRRGANKAPTGRHPRKRKHTHTRNTHSAPCAVLIVGATG
eukprot:scaffold101595_cov63-Phaeocystis_antarctica.AAC.4